MTHNKPLPTKVVLTKTRKRRRSDEAQPSAQNNVCRISGVCEKLSRLFDEICTRARKQSRQGILNPFCKKLPKTGANDGYYTRKQKQTAPMIAKKKKNYKNKYQQIHSNKWENDKRTGRLKKKRA